MLNGRPFNNRTLFGFRTATPPAPTRALEPSSSVLEALGIVVGGFG